MTHWRSFSFEDSALRLWSRIDWMKLIIMWKANEGRRACMCVCFGILELANVLNSKIVVAVVLEWLITTHLTQSHWSDQVPGPTPLWASKAVHFTNGPQLDDSGRVWNAIATMLVLPLLHYASSNHSSQNVSKHPGLENQVAVRVCLITGFTVFIRPSTWFQEPSCQPKAQGWLCQCQLGSLYLHPVQSDAS